MEKLDKISYERLVPSVDTAVGALSPDVVLGVDIESSAKAESKRTVVLDADIKYANSLISLFRAYL